MDLLTTVKKYIKYIIVGAIALVAIALVFVLRNQYVNEKAENFTKELSNASTKLGLANEEESIKILNSLDDKAYTFGNKLILTLRKVEQYNKQKKYNKSLEEIKKLRKERINVEYKNYLDYLSNSILLEQSSNNKKKMAELADNIIKNNNNKENTFRYLNLELVIISYIQLSKYEDALKYANEVLTASDISDILKLRISNLKSVALSYVK